MPNGKQAIETKKAKYGEDYMSIIGSKGGKKKGVIKGFAYMKLHHPEKYAEMMKKIYESRTKGKK